MNFQSILFTVLLWSFSFRFSSVTYSLIVKSHVRNDTKVSTHYYAIYEKEKNVFEFPDILTLQETLRILDMKTDIPEISAEIIPRRVHVDAILPSIIDSSFHRNALLAFIIQRNSFFQSAKFTLLENVWNPAIARWLNQTVVSWRAKGIVQFAFLKTFSEIDFSPRMNLGGPDAGKYVIPNNGNKQEDPRLLLLSNNKLLVAFTAVTAPNGKKRIPHAFQSFSLGHFDKTSQGIVFEEPYLFDQDFGGWQKNWVPFEYSNEIYFIQRIFPPRIFRVLGKYSNNHTAQYEEISPATVPASLPWKEEFGILRGGTPALLLPGRGLYLMIFHSVYQFRDYYMGAITFCAAPPFAIHSISPVPIVNLQFYHGQKMSRKVPYVVFPTSLILSEDPKEVILTFGHQDKNGYLTLLRLEKLLDSMVEVHKC
jgi:predicted GH43/DUF377 family glycosyl hydrolase